MLPDFDANKPSKFSIPYQNLAWFRELGRATRELGQGITPEGPRTIAGGGARKRGTTGYCPLPPGDKQPENVGNDKLFKGGGNCNQGDTDPPPAYFRFFPCMLGVVGGRLKLLMKSFTSIIRTFSPDL